MAIAFFDEITEKNFKEAMEIFYWMIDYEYEERIDPRTRIKEIRFNYPGIENNEPVIVKHWSNQTNISTRLHIKRLK